MSWRAPKMAPGEEFTNVTRGATNFFFFLLKSRKMLAVCFIRSDDCDGFFNPQAFTSAWIFNLISYLTSKPRSAVGLCRGRMNTEALAGQHVTVFGFLHQEANLCQQAVQEAGQHGGASDHHQVLREHFTGVDGALKQTQTDILKKNKNNNSGKHLFFTIRLLPRGKRGRRWESSQHYRRILVKWAKTTWYITGTVTLLWVVSGELQYIRTLWAVHYCVTSDLNVYIITVKVWSCVKSAVWVYEFK